MAMDKMYRPERDGLKGQPVNGPRPVKPGIKPKPIKIRQTPKTTKPARMNSKVDIDDRVIRRMPITQNQLARIKRMYGIK
jgi:hypothetical protein